MGARGKLRTLEGRRVAFMCPGCRELHQVGIGDGPGPRWGFNGDYDRPTLSPSVLVRGHQTIRDENDKWTGEWKRDAAGNPVASVCHSVVRDGQIQFLGDCSHALAGKTVELPDTGDGA